MVALPWIVKVIVAPTNIQASGSAVGSDDSDSSSVKGSGDEEVIEIDGDGNFASV